MSVYKKGENHPSYGRKHTELEIYKMKEARKKIDFKGENHPMYGKHLTEETKQKLRQYTGEKSANWQGGIGFYPYCDKFNAPKREEIRNKYDRKCFICNLEEKYNITKTNKIRKLSVHHIDDDKEQGCNDKPWFLVPLCMKCHGRVTHKKSKVYWIKYIQLLIKFYAIKDVWKWWL